MITIREYIEGKADLKISAYGTSEGANKGWDSRGRGRAKKNFEPPSSVDKMEPHKYKGPGNAICQTCGNTLNHPIHKDFNLSEPLGDYKNLDKAEDPLRDTNKFYDKLSVPEQHQRKIAEADAKMPKAMRDVMSPSRK